MSKSFTFDLFRLNIEDTNNLFLDKKSLRIRNDEQITNILKESCEAAHDQVQKTKSAVFKWSHRTYLNLANIHEYRNLHYLILARSVLEKDGFVVTDSGLSSTTSISFPPLASAVVCIFDLSRHLIAIEHSGQLSQTAWRDFLQKILTHTAIKLGFNSTIEIEPVPEHNDIVGLFLSFQRITRMKLTLRIPNPELTRYTREIYNDLKNSDIREITQDMKNPNGLSKSKEARPFGCAVLAEQGYKKGTVTIEGLRNKKTEPNQTRADTAQGASRGKQSYIHGINSTIKTKEAQTALNAICAEIDRISPQIE